jgi:hypothetical protein
MNFAHRNDHKCQSNLNDEFYFSLKNNIEIIIILLIIPINIMTTNLTTPRK